jgi:hypothetical protein
VASLAALLVFASARSVAEPQAPPPSLTLEEYQATLQQWSSEVGRISADSSIAQKLRDSLPKSVQVRIEPKTIESSTAWLNTALETLQKTKPEKRADLIKKIQARLEAMQHEARQFSQPAGATSDSQAKLKAILAAREFKAVRGPSAWQLLKEKIERAINKALGKIFSNVAAPAQAGQALVWVAIAIAACVLAIWLRRRLTAAAQDIRRQPVPFAAPSHKGSRRWLAEAQAAALEGKWRDAIHLAYWAGVARLEEGGAWVPDRARTPREYLRLLRPENHYRPPLAELTRSFEVIWYGDRPASSADFQHAVVQLERLQCRL